MTAPTILSSSYYSSASNTSTYVIPVPSGITSGDLLVVIFSEEQTSSVYTSNDGGFTTAGVLSSDGATRTNFTVLSKTATGSETNLTITLSSGRNTNAIYLRTDSTGIVVATGTLHPTTSNVVFADYTTTDTDSMLLFSAMSLSSGIITSGGLPSGTTLIAAGNTGTPVSHSTGYAYQTFTTSGTLVTGKIWTTAADTFGSIVVELLGISSSPLSLDDINTDEDVTDGEQDSTFTTSGGTPEITGVDLISGAYTLSATGVTSTSGAGTFDLPDVSSYTVDTAGIPFGSVTFRVTDTAAGTADLSGTYSVKSGWAVVTVASAVATEDSIFYYRSGGAPTDGSQIYYDTSDNTVISADGTWVSDVSIITPKVLVAGTWEPVTAAVLEECVISMTADGDDTPFLGVYQNSTLGQYVLVHQEDTGEPFFGSTSIPVATHSVAIRVNTDNPELLIDDVSEVTSTLSFASTTGIALSGIGALTKTSVTDYTGITVDDVTLTDPNNSSNNRLYECDEGSGTTLNDSLGSLETATLINGATWSVAP